MRLVHLAIAGAFIVTVVLVSLAESYAGRARVDVAVDLQSKSAVTNNDNSQGVAHPTTHLYVPPPGTKIPLPPGAKCNPAFNSASTEGCNTSK
jgi:hypothetical protein